MMKNIRGKLLSKSGFAASIIAILAGLIVGFIILLITNPAQALPGFWTILKGGFTGGSKGIGDMIYLATPIIMTGLSVGFAFKTGLFNIGASGQLIVGAFVAVYIGVLAQGLGTAHWLVALLAAMIAGALWAVVPGLLKALFNVHEVISCIMMNYIGMYLVNMLVKETPVYDSYGARTLAVQSTANIPTIGLDKLTNGSRLSSGILVALLFVIVLFIVLNKTTFGYELKACGHNADASIYAGINAKRNIILSMAIAGAMAGVAGALIYLTNSGRFIPVIDLLAPEGFDGISVALLGLSSPLGILFSGLFIAYLKSGGFYMQLYDFVPEVIEIMVSIIIYFSAFALLVRNFFIKYTLNTEIESTGKTRKPRRTKGKAEEVEKNE